MQDPSATFVGALLSSVTYSAVVPVNCRGGATRTLPATDALATLASLLAATAGLPYATKVLDQPVVRCPAQVKKVIGFCGCLRIKLASVLCGFYQFFTFSQLVGVLNVDVFKP